MLLIDGAYGSQDVLIIILKCGAHCGEPLYLYALSPTYDEKFYFKFRFLPFFQNKIGEESWKDFRQNCRKKLRNFEYLIQVRENSIGAVLFK